MTHGVGSASGTDGVALALLSSRLDTIVRKTANTLVRTARSPSLNTANDFSCCLLTADSRLISAAESLPIHVFRGADMMHRQLVELHPVMRDGDAYLNNSPYHGNNHAADWVIFVPVLDPGGRHRFTVLSKAHLDDIGNAAPTTINPFCQDVYAEGALIFPFVKVQDDNKTNEDFVRTCEARLRQPEVWRGDFAALIGSARIGAREMRLLGEELGWDTVDDLVGQWLDYSDGQMRQMISQLPAGTATATSVHDAFEGCPEIPVTATVTVDPVAPKITVDFRDNIDCLPNGMNLSEASSLTAGMVGVFMGLPDIVPANSGSMRTVEVLIREGCIVGIPKHPTSCSAATTNVADRAVNAVQLALGRISDGLGMAEIGGAVPASVGPFAISALEHPSAPSLGACLLGATGGAATPHVDGWLTAVTAGVNGTVGRGVAEILELAHPLYVWIDELEPDSEGAGRTRGAPAGHVEIGLHAGHALNMFLFSDGSVHAAQGVSGGRAGQPARQGVLRTDGTMQPTPGFGPVTINPGERLVSYSTSGGGYGDPLERPAELVLRDVQDALISPARAASVYGVQVSDDLSAVVGMTKERQAVAGT